MTYNERRIARFIRRYGLQWREYSEIAIVLAWEGTFQWGSIQFAFAFHDLKRKIVKATKVHAIPKGYKP